MRAPQLGLGPVDYTVSTGRHWQDHGRSAEISAPTGGAGAETRIDVWAEDLWTNHGQSVYLLACALSGDKTAAMRAVALAMVDFARSDVATSDDDTPLALARHVYRRSTHRTSQTSGSTSLPPAMVWLAQLAQLQRACLALCAFGGFTSTDAAELLDITPLTVAQLLSSGLDELKRLSQPVIVT